MPSTQTWPGTRTVDLPFSYDYPDIERVAGLSRYGQNHDQYDGLQPNSIRISMRTLRQSVVILSEYDGTPHDHEADAEIAMSLLRIVVAYFEGMRFHDISNRIHEARLDEGYSWTVDYRAAVITNNWRSLTEFGSRTSLRSSDTDSDNISQRMELRGRRRPSQEPRIWVTSSLQDINNHLQSWGAILAVALTPRWVVPDADSCSHRQRRDVSSLEAPPLELKGECEKLLLQIGSTFFDRSTGYAVLESAISTY
ncbi:ribosome-inactivating family protein [Haematospirillum jordaniae]|uniref:ribosome-inactivating family protein n=1 Tax=Haematospirillum jordaniae TaxID=1549855 RepID=UPI001FD7AE14|nr:ribosome-inactivating family protein [Haematospirillum jordaniae]